MDEEKQAGMTIGRGVVIAIDANPRRAWIRTPSGGRLFFSILHAWKSNTPPVVGDSVMFRQHGSDFKSVKRI
jgi:hypothetical protein